MLKVFSKKENEKYQSHDFVPYEKIDDKTSKTSKDETKLEELLFDNPEIFPVEDMTDGESGHWIPLARQITVPNHGILDIIATDDIGTIYIVECKLRHNGDMKTIRGQISDYVSGIYRDTQLDIEPFWDWLCKEIEKKTNKSLEHILDDAKVEDPKKIMNVMKTNFKDKEITLVYAVDEISDGLWDAVIWHNKAVNTEHNYPCFAIQVRKYNDEGRDGGFFVAVQNFPFNLQEIVSQRNKTPSIRRRNDESSWNTKFEDNKMDTEQKEKIMDFKEKLKKLIEKDSGVMIWGSADPSRMMPRFKSHPDRSPIGLLPNGVLKLQFSLIHGSKIGPEAGIEFRKNIGEMNGLTDLIPNFAVNAEPPLKPELWLPHKDEILSILEQIFVEKQ